jgi:hypothetical protein
MKEDTEGSLSAMKGPGMVRDKERDREREKR